MASVNSVTILGNVGKDPEIRSFPNGGRVANFSVATSERWKDKSSGEYKEKSEWHNVSVTNEALVGIVEKYVKKGSKVYLVGQLQTRKWTDNSGADKYSTEVVLKPFKGELVLLDSKQANEQPASEPIVESSFGSGFEDDLDDILPF